MGTWGPGNFENDEALDWVAELETYADDGPEEVEIWVEGRPAPLATMISQARYVSEAVLENSELKDLWKESDEFESWQTSVNDLLGRLLY